MTSRTVGSLIAVVVMTTALAMVETPLRAVWPPLAALLVILATRRALTGLLVGGYVGAVLLADGDPWSAYLAIFGEHLAPSLASPWKTGAIAFTLVLGGFAAVLDAGGGFRTLLGRLARSGSDTGRRFQTAAAGLGLLCYFDGLANSMMVGRVGRELADRSGVARVKLAYIVDSTSSAVACVAVVSTWIAFQLSMIEEGFVLAGRDVNPYAVFLQSLPYNFHCWFTLVLLFAAIRWGFAPGAMRAFEVEARRRHEAAIGDTTVVAVTSTADMPKTITPTTDDAERAAGGVAVALVPLAVLLTAFGVGFIVLGSPRPLWPLERDKVVAAFGSDAGPLVMVLAGLAATVAAVLLFPRRPEGRLRAAAVAFATGVRTMIGPVFILLAAWILGSVVQALGTAELIASLLSGAEAPFLIPTLTFVTGALISFATGTSWGTMGLLFPLALPAAAAAAVSGSLPPAAQESLLHIVVAAVFSGAVFGDHCSPFSDTTIVTSIACGVEPHDHVRTQIPYALITAAVAVVCGFLPAGLGLPVWISLVVGVLALLAIARFGQRSG